MRNLRNLTLIGILSVAAPVNAQTDAAAEIAALRSEIGRLAERLDRLENAQGSTGVPNAATAQGASASAPAAPSSPAAAPSASAQAAKASDATLRFSGDMRYRHEAINDEAFPERERQRIRARFGLTADLGDRITVGLTLATGELDPVSANQTLDGGFDRNSFGVDRAFFTWRATDALSFTGGKMANPFFRPGNHHLIYDSDLNPEGLSLRYTGGNWFANAAGLWVDERPLTDDAILLGGQAGFRRTSQGGTRITAGVSYYDYWNTQGEIPFFDGLPAGNRIDANGRYLNDFNDAELFAELGLNAGGRPVVLFADYVVNTEAAAADTGFAIGVAYGEASRRGTWRVGYAYQDLEADAVIGMFTDSDFGGGGTDNKGHVVELTYALRTRWLLNFRYFLNERAMDVGRERDYNRLQADLMFNY